MAKKPSGYYSPEAIQARQQVQVDEYNRQQAEVKKKVEQPSSTMSGDKQGNTITPPTGGTGEFQVTPPDGKLEWDYKTAQTDLSGKPVQTRSFFGLDIKPQGFDPQGNPYFGGGFNGWMKKWAYNFSEEAATKEDAEESWKMFWETSAQLSQNVTTFDKNATQEQKRAQTQEQGYLFLQGASQLFESIGKSAESSKASSILTPIVRSVNTLVGMTLEVFSMPAEGVERSLATSRAMREYANANSTLPTLDFFDDEDEAVFESNRPAYAKQAEERVGLRSEAAEIATRAFVPILQMYDAFRFATAPGTLKEKQDALAAGWTEGRMLYSELYKPAIREEYLKRVQAGEDPELLTMELEDPWVEAIGEVILDPLNFIGAGGKAAKAGETALEAAKATSKSGLLAVPEFADELAALGKASSEADSIKAMTKIEDRIIQAVSETGRAIESAQSWKAVELTPAGNRFRQTRNVSNYLNNIVQGVRNSGGDANEIMDFVNALVKRASGDRNAIKESIAAISHSKFQALAYNQTAFDTGHMLNKLLGDGDTLIKALNNSTGDWSDLTRILDDKIKDSVKFAFPDVSEMSKAADKVKEVGELADPKTKVLAERYNEFVKTNPGVARWQKVQTFAEQALKPINGFLANSYFSLSYGYAFRNFMQNMVTLWADDGILLTKEAFGEFSKSGIKTPRLDDAIIKSIGYIPESLKGKTLTQSVTEGSLLKKMFGKLNEWGYSPAALADAAEVYAGKMIFMKKYRASMDKIMKPGALLPDLATWNKAGFAESQVNDFVDILRANHYNEADAVSAFTKKYGNGTVDKWRQLDWVNADVKKGLQEYDTLWDDIVNLTNKEGVSQSEILDAIDELKIKVKKNANKAATEPSRMDNSNPVWKDISNARDQAGKFADDVDDNKLQTLTTQFDRVAAEFNDTLNEVAKKMRGDPEMQPLIARIQDFTSNKNRQALNEVVRGKTEELRQWTVNIYDSKKNAFDLWDEAVLGKRPAGVSRRQLHRAIWDRFFSERMSTWGEYFKKYTDQASALATETGQTELFGKAKQALLELQQYRDYVYNGKGIHTKPPTINPAKVGDAANANNIRSVANTYGLPSMSANGKPTDNQLLNIINKYAPPQVDVVQEVAKVQDAAAEVKPVLTIDEAARKRDLEDLKNTDFFKKLQEDVKKYRKDKPVQPSNIEAKALETKVVQAQGDAPTTAGKLDLNINQEQRARDLEDIKSSDFYKKLKEDVQKYRKDKPKVEAPKIQEAAPLEVGTPRYSRLEDVPPMDAERAIAKHQGQEYKGFFEKQGDTYTPKPVTEGIAVPPPRDPNTSPGSHVFTEGRQGTLDALDHVRNGIVERWGLRAPAGADMDAFKQLTKELPERMTVARSQSQIVAEKFRDFALLPYGETKNMDFAMSLVYPYQFWYSRSYKNWMQRAFMTNPEIISRYANLKEAMASQQRDLPDWWKSQVNVSGMLGIETDNPVYINLEATLFPLYGLTGVDFNDPVKRSNWFTSTLDDMGKFGPSVWAPIQWATAAYLYANGEKEAASRWGSRLIPQTATVKSISSYFGTPIEIDPMIQLFSGNGLFDTKASDPYEEGRIARALSAMESEGKYTKEELMDAMYSQKGEIWDEAYQRAVNERAGGQLSSFFLGVGFKGRSQSDIQIDQFYADYSRLKNLFYSDHVTKEQYQNSMNEMRNTYPFMDMLLLSRRAGDGRDAAYAYNVISRLPPGMSKEMLEMAGIDPRTAEKFYESGGKLDSMPETERQRFLAGIMDMAALLKMPNDATRQEWTLAKQTYSKMNELLAQKYGEDIQDKISAYYDLDTNKQKAYLEAYPEVKEAMDAQTAYIANTPILSSYYGGLQITTRFYENQMYDQLEQEFGADIQEKMEQYYFLKDNLQNAEAKAFYNANNLKAYETRKKALRVEYEKQIMAAASQIPEAEGYGVRPEFSPETGIQEDMYQLATTDQQAEMAQNIFTQLSPAVQNLLQESFQTGEPVPSAVLRQVKFIANKYGLSEYEAMRIMGIEQ